MKREITHMKDFMAAETPWFRRQPDFVLRVKAIRGDVPFRLEFPPRFNYGRPEHQLVFKPLECIFTSEGPERAVVRLRTTVPLRIHGTGVAADFVLKGGETAAFILEEACCKADTPSGGPRHVSDFFKGTSDCWRRWIALSRSATCYLGKRMGSYQHSNTNFHITA